MVGLVGVGGAQFDVGGTGRRATVAPPPRSQPRPTSSIYSWQRGSTHLNNIIPIDLNNYHFFFTFLFILINIILFLWIIICFYV